MTPHPHYYNSQCVAGVVARVEAERLFNQGTDICANVEVVACECDIVLVEDAMLEIVVVDGAVGVANVKEVAYIGMSTQGTMRMVVHRISRHRQKRAMHRGRCQKRRSMQKMT